MNFSAISSSCFHYFVFFVLFGSSTFFHGSGMNFKHDFWLFVSTAKVDGFLNSKSRTIFLKKIVF